MKNITPLSSTKDFIHSEDGSATPLAIGFSIIFIVLGGLAIDYNKAMGERTQLQMAADSAAHAALYTWEFQDTTVSTATAQTTIAGMLPEVAFSGALEDTDIEYGFWDPALGTFTIDPNFVEDKDDPRRSAVRAFAELEPERNNESRNIMLSIVGQDTFTIRTSSIYASYYPPCFSEGFVAEGVVDMQSNSMYLDGFCIHSNTYVSLNQNNFFEPGTVVSMPNLADLDIPSSGFEQNPGLQAALRTGEYRLRILRQLPMMFASLRAGSSKYAEVANITQPTGSSTPLPVLAPIDMSGTGNNAITEQDILDAIAMHESGDSTLLDNLPRIPNTDTGKKGLKDIQFYPKNRIFELFCTGNGEVDFGPEQFSDFVLVTNCPVKTSNGTVFNEVLVATEEDVSASHLQIGLNDSCADGGGASIWTYGSFNAASNLQGYGAQILALGDIDFAASADGIEGVSFIAGGHIEGTSGNQMGYCDGDGTGDFVAAPYYRMVN